jgi:hypothetical protein
MAQAEAKVVAAKAPLIPRKFCLHSLGADATQSPFVPSAPASAKPYNWKRFIGLPFDAERAEYGAPFSGVTFEEFRAEAVIDPSGLR